MSFKNLGLLDQILSALTECGYTTPTQIQEKTIPHILRKKDILGGAQTGTGKTASFMLPLLQLAKEQKRETNKAKLTALILVPTRELAAQVHESILTYGKYLHLKSTVVFGGVGIKPQMIKLRKGVDILVATPGRLLDHVNQKTVDLSSINMLVLDEADCMLDMGFIHDIRKILSVVPKKRQTLLFSATFSEAIKELAENFLTDPEMVQLSGNHSVSDQVKQVIYPVDKARKQELLLDLMRKNNWKQVLIFMRTKHGANKLSEQLEKEGIRAAAIHGNKTQAARTKSLLSFKRGDIRVLVATDIAARGLNISQLPHVVNFELPTVASDYVHRIGRTGRAGNVGEAISLLCVDEHGLLRDIERLIKRSLPQEVLQGYEVDPSIKPQPIRKGGAKKNFSQRKRPSARPANPKREKYSQQKQKPAPKKKPLLQKQKKPIDSTALTPKTHGKKKAVHQAKYTKSPFHKTQKRKKNEPTVSTGSPKGKKPHSKFMGRINKKGRDFSKNK